MVLIVLGATFYWFAPGDGSNFGGQSLRVGLVFGALWLAFPQILALMKSAPGWLVGWFLGKGKPPAKSSSDAPQAEVVSQPTKVKRPRRRSNA